MHHTIIALVEDKPGVLNRVALVFRRRAFNIESLTVGRTTEPGVSRMTIVLDSDQTRTVVATTYAVRAGRLAAGSAKRKFAAVETTNGTSAITTASVICRTHRFDGSGSPPWSDRASRM